jgi:hypothetical protein
VASIFVRVRVDQGSTASGGQQPRDLGRLPSGHDVQGSVGCCFTNADQAAQCLATM